MSVSNCTNMGIGSIGTSVKWEYNGLEDVIDVPDRTDLMVNVVEAGQNREQDIETEADVAVKEEETISRHRLYSNRDHQWC